MPLSTSGSATTGQNGTDKALLLPDVFASDPNLPGYADVENFLSAASEFNIQQQKSLNEIQKRSYDQLRNDIVL